MPAKPIDSQKRDQGSQGQDGAEPAQKQAAHQCRFCTEPATRTVSGRHCKPRDAPTDLSVEELDELERKKRTGGDPLSPHWCETCRGLIKRFRENAKKKPAKKKGAAKKAKQDDGSAALRPLCELPTYIYEPCHALVRSQRHRAHPVAT